MESRLDSGTEYPRFRTPLTIIFWMNRRKEERYEDRSAERCTAGKCHVSSDSAAEHHATMNTFINSSIFIRTTSHGVNLVEIEGVTEN